MSYDVKMMSCVTNLDFKSNCVCKVVNNTHLKQCDVKSCHVKLMLCDANAMGEYCTDIVIIYHSHQYHRSQNPCLVMDRKGFHMIQLDTVHKMTCRVTHILDKYNGLRYTQYDNCNEQLSVDCLGLQGWHTSLAGNVNSRISNPSLVHSYWPRYPTM